MSTSYCEVGEVAERAGVDDTDEDGRIANAIEAASRQIDQWCGQFFYQEDAVSTREFFAGDSMVLDLLDQPGSGLLAPISTVTGLIVKLDEANTGAFGTTLTINTHFLLHPRNAVAEGLGFTSILLPETYTFPQPANGRAGVQITAKFGWPTVPPEVAEACRIQAAQLWKAKDAVFGAVSLGEAGALYVKAALNPISRGLLAGHKLARY